MRRLLSHRDIGSLLREREDVTDIGAFREARIELALRRLDLAVHLADEVISSPEINKANVVERTANLLYGVRLVAPEHGVEKAAELLLADLNG